MKWNTEDTIAAVATPMGVGGVGIVRLSGKNSLEIANPLFRPAIGGQLSAQPSHLMVYGWLLKGTNLLDEVLAVQMKSPRSYTGEDVVEFHCHGGVMVLKTVLELLGQLGARMAEPGEFTFRAFLNGRIDLTQVEAVADIVQAGSAEGLRVSVNQLKGKLHEEILALKESVSSISALVAAGIDFPEEDVVFAQAGEVDIALSEVEKRMADLMASAHRGRILREGLMVSIVGSPNVGKSSLLNALLGENRAIVTEIPGTTRDTLEEACELGGLLVRLIDTAGIRATEDRVESEGIARSLKAAEQADLVLWVMDGSAPLDPGFKDLKSKMDPASALVVVNKRDLMSGDDPPWLSEISGYPNVKISAKSSKGLKNLEKAVVNWAMGTSQASVHTEHAMLTNLRQVQAAGRAGEALTRARLTLSEARGDELLAVDLQEVLDALGDIVGETTAEDLLEKIFSEFCIGK